MSPAVYCLLHGFRFLRCPSDQWRQLYSPQIVCLQRACNVTVVLNVSPGCHSCISAVQCDYHFLSTNLVESIGCSQCPEMLLWKQAKWMQIAGCTTNTSKVKKLGTAIQSYFKVILYHDFWGLFEIIINQQQLIITDSDTSGLTWN